MPGTVTVACKVPNGVILRAFKLEPRVELLQSGATRDTKIAVPVSNTIKINGPGRIDRIQRGPAASGYALTYNVDADVWDAWLRDNAQTDIVQNKLIFAHAKQAEVSAAARENEGRISGLEPMDPSGDRRSPKRRVETKAGSVGVLETADRTAA